VWKKISIRKVIKLILLDKKKYWDFMKKWKAQYVWSPQSPMGLSDFFLCISTWFDFLPFLEKTPNFFLFHYTFLFLFYIYWILLSKQLSLFVMKNAENYFLCTSYWHICSKEMPLSKLAVFHSTTTFIFQTILQILNEKNEHIALTTSDGSRSKFFDLGRVRSAINGLVLNLENFP